MIKVSSTIYDLMGELNKKVNGYVQYNRDKEGGDKFNLYNHNKLFAKDLDIDDVELLLNYLIKWEETK